MVATRQTYEIQVAGETLHLLPERAVYWPAESCLFLSDLHWGKGETFRQHGIPIPPAMFEDDMARLSEVIRESQARQVLILGDLIHGKLGITSDLDQQIRAWRQDFADISFKLIPGNHDRPIQPFLTDWQIDLAPLELDWGPFCFSHHPDPKPGRFVFSGHVHPTVKIGNGADSLRLPCFLVGQAVGIVPAFSAFTSGFNVTPQVSDRLFVIADNQVVPFML